MKGALEVLHGLDAALRFGADGTAWLDGQLLRARDAENQLRLWAEARCVSRLPQVLPAPARASGDSGFVAHLSAVTRGASGWEPGFKLLQVSPGDESGSQRQRGWAFASDGRLCLFLDEPRQYQPADAKVGDKVSVRVPRARENLYPHRFTLYGGQGSAVAARGSEPARYTKLFVAFTLDGAVHAVSQLSSRLGDKFRFTFLVSNDPRQLDRADSAICDVSLEHAEEVTRLLLEMVRGQPQWVKPLPAPAFSEALLPGLARAPGDGVADLGDGFARRRCGAIAKAVREGLEAGERRADQWADRLILA